MEFTKFKMTGKLFIKTIQPSKNDKNTKLILSLLFDGIGMISYLFPVYGEMIDLIWAPISGVFLFLMYKGTIGKLAGIFGCTEELIPFVDIIPTFTITWLYVFVLKGANKE
jgi:hypothetical protein